MEVNVKTPGNEPTDQRGQADFVGHVVVDDWTKGMATFENIIVQSDKPEEAWIEPVCRLIGEWRATFRSAYIRWALALNGLDVAAARYASAEWQQKGKEFFVGSRDHLGREVKLVVMNGPDAAEAHRSTVPLMAAYGLIDMYSALEECVFKLYRAFLDVHPDALLQGDDYKPLRKLRAAAARDAGQRAAWDAAWTDRLARWQQKQLYSGLGRVFRAFCSVTELKAPTTFKLSTTETWAETIEGVGIVRHLLIHGVRTADAGLAKFCTKPYRLGFEFKEGDKLDIHLGHLQSVQVFCEQLLSALNLSLVERVGGKLPKERAATA